MAHDPHLWHAIDRLACVLNEMDENKFLKMDAKRRNKGGLFSAFGSTKQVDIPGSFKIDGSETYEKIGELLETYYANREKASGSDELKTQVPLYNDMIKMLERMEENLEKVWLAMKKEETDKETETNAYKTKVANDETAYKTKVANNETAHNTKITNIETARKTAVDEATKSFKTDHTSLENTWKNTAPWAPKFT